VENVIKNKSVPGWVISFPYVPNPSGLRLSYHKRFSEWNMFVDNKDVRE
jgi:hypothetical protein